MIHAEQTQLKQTATFSSKGEIEMWVNVLENRERASSMQKHWLEEWNTFNTQFTAAHFVCHKTYCITDARTRNGRFAFSRKIAAKIIPLAI